MENGVMMQYFEWNMPNDGDLWNQLKRDASHLHAIGITAVWIPPAYKALKQDDEGYGTYDLYDLGEFDQKETIRTKYGTKQQLQEMIDELHKNQVGVYLDAVMNHKAGADYTEKFMAREVNPDQRTEQLGEPYEIEGWTGFNFPGRGNKYSDFKWHWYHFSGIDCDVVTGKKGIFQIVGEGKTWSEGVDDENGNYDFLMFADIDFDHPEVVEEMKKWGIWVSQELHLDGMRLDAIKHINDQFIAHFLEAVRAKQGQQFYAVGEYWKNDKDSLDKYLSEVKYKIDLFDVPLHYHFFQASQKGRDYDLQELFNDTLVNDHPDLAVTFVDNHDTEPGQALCSFVDSWFKPLAYALILLREAGYPCVFYGDCYGIPSRNVAPVGKTLTNLLSVRASHAYGAQHDYFDDYHCIGFTREGLAEDENTGLACILSSKNDTQRTMYVGKQHSGQKFFDVLFGYRHMITIDADGNGTFPVHGRSVSVWIPV